MRKRACWGGIVIKTQVSKGMYLIAGHVIAYDCQHDDTVEDCL